MPFLPILFIALLIQAVSCTSHSPFKFMNMCQHALVSESSHPPRYLALPIEVL